MGRRPGVWWRESAGLYYTTIDGKQVPLDAQKNKSLDMLAERLTENAAPDDNSAIADVILRYSEHAKETMTASRFADVDRALTDFAKRFGRLKVKTLKPAHMEAWRKAHSAPGTGRKRPWTSSTFRSKVDCVRGAISWAVGLGNISKNPLGAYRGGQMARRDHLITDAEFALIQKHAKPWLKNLSLAIRLTGCRPSEACRVTAADYDAGRKCWILVEHKTKDKKPSPRVIWLSQEMVDLTERLCKENPAGPIFRGAKGTPIGKFMVTWGFSAVRKKCKDAGTPVDPRVCAYLLRHAWITQALSNGLDVSLVATMAGTSVRILMRHYQHLLALPLTMNAAAERATKKG